MKNITQEDVKKEQLTQLLASDALSRLSNLILALIFGYVISEVLPQKVVFTWVISLVVINLSRFIITRQFINNPTDNPTEIDKRIKIYRICIYLTSAAWGVCALLLYEKGHFEHQLFLAFMIAGLSAGSAFVFSMDMVSASAYLICSVVPMLLSFLFSNHELLFVMALPCTLYVFFMFTTLLSFNRRIIEGIKLRLQAQINAAETKQLAFYDELTGLPNRRMLLERLERIIVSNIRTQKFSAILFIDLDNFKKLNDTLGHDTGDELLKQVAARLQASVRASDTVSRFGGDEFVVLLENLNNNYDGALKEAEKVANTILSNLNKPYFLISTEYISTPSIGISISDDGGKSLRCLLKEADIAMYDSKLKGRNRVCIYNDSMINEA